MTYSTPKSSLQGIYRAGLISSIKPAGPFYMGIKCKRDQQDTIKYSIILLLTMPKWEYMVLEFQPTGFGLRIPSVIELNTLGDLGWKISASGGLGGYSDHANPFGIKTIPGTGWIILMREKI